MGHVHALKRTFYMFPGLKVSKNIANIFFYPFYKWKKGCSTHRAVPLCASLQLALFFVMDSRGWGGPTVHSSLVWRSKTLLLLLGMQSGRIALSELAIVALGPVTKKQEVTIIKTTTAKKEEETSLFWSLSARRPLAKSFLPVRGKTNF